MRKPQIRILRTVLTYVLSSFALLVNAQDTAAPAHYQFYDELNEIVLAFNDTTNTDTLVVCDSAISGMSSFVGYEILNDAQIKSLIKNNDLKRDNDSNNILFEQYMSFTYQGSTYQKAYSYATFRKQLPYTEINGSLYSNLFGLNIIEKITITSENLPGSIEVNNSYCVLYDDSTLTDSIPKIIIAYNETTHENASSLGKYFVDLSAAKSSSIIPVNLALDEYLTISPNPVHSKLKVDVKLEHSDDAVLVICDAVGKKVKVTDLGYLKRQVPYSFFENTSELVAGVYTVTLSTRHSNKTTKLIVSK